MDGYDVIKQPVFIFASGTIKKIKDMTFKRIRVVILVIAVTGKKISCFKTSCLFLYFLKFKFYRKFCKVPLVNFAKAAISFLLKSNHLVFNFINNKSAINEHLTPCCYSVAVTLLTRR